MPIITNIASSNAAQARWTPYNIMWLATGRWFLLFPPPIVLQDITEILLKVALSSISIKATINPTLEYWLVVAGIILHQSVTCSWPDIAQSNACLTLHNNHSLSPINKDIAYFINSDHINQFNTKTFSCQFQTRSWISNIICHDLLLVFKCFRWELFVSSVDFGRIVDHHCLNLTFHKPNIVYIYFQTSNFVNDIWYQCTDYQASYITITNVVCCRIK